MGGYAYEPDILEKHDIAFRVTVSQCFSVLTQARKGLVMRAVFLTIVLLITVPAAAQTYVLGEGSEARFSIDEVLLGNDKTVVGVTPNVTGELSFDLANPQAAQIGMISIDARDLTTDDNRRNRQIQNRILNANEDAFQFITFEPTSITGLPESAAIGDSFEVQITGNLTIKDVTREEVFAVTVTVAENTLQGLGSSTIIYADYGVSVPTVPIVASVSDEVTLELEFVAVAN